MQRWLICLFECAVVVPLNWNAPQAAFDNPAQDLFKGKSVDDVLVANTTNYAFCGMEALPSFSCFDVMKAPTIEDDMARLRAHLAEFVGVPA